MSRYKAVIVTIFLSVNIAPAIPQDSAWQTLPNAPLTSRHNDVYFVSEERGWVVDGRGDIYRTIDGGATWKHQFGSGETHFRSVGFLDSLKGWAGNVGVGEFGATDTTILYQTMDGGNNWQRFNEFQGEKPVGLCGMYVLNDSCIFTVGRVRGPAFFAKTTDGGQTWISKDMNDLAAGLIDVFFFSPDTGIAVGLDNPDHTFSSGIILGTTDGGETWDIRHTTDRNGEWCWKVTFPSRKVGYSSLQRNQLAPIYLLKTTDGGLTWESLLFSQTYYFVQGIGFLTESLGWIGGNSSFPVYETTDGGETWHATNFGTRVNRFRFVTPSVGYAVGETVYKYKTDAVFVEEDTRPAPGNFTLSQNYPNPFNPVTQIRYILEVPDYINLSIFNLRGEKVKILHEGGQAAGQHTISWNGKDDLGQEVASGIYFCRLHAGRVNESRRMLLLR